MESEAINQLVNKALAIEEINAREANAIGFMSRLLVQVTMPHSETRNLFFERSNGNLSLAMTAHPKVGLPYGTYPRLILCWLVTEAVKVKKPTLVLGKSLSQFMSEIGLNPTGGRWGTISMLKNQMSRLFSSSVSCVYKDGDSTSGVNFNIASSYQLWWNPKQPDQTTLWESTITLNEDFYKEIIKRPVPIDIRVLNAIKGSAMAIDLYCWITYRMSYLKKRTEIPWELLQNQFGAGYSLDRKGKYEFKRKLKSQLKKVILFYSDAKILEGDKGLVLLPSRTHISRG